MVDGYKLSVGVIPLSSSRQIDVMNSNSNPLLVIWDLQFITSTNDLNKLSSPYTSFNYETFWAKLIIVCKVHCISNVQKNVQ